MPWCPRTFFAAGLSGMEAHRLPQAVAAMLGLAGPVAVGATFGRPGMGLVASLGGLALSRSGKGDTLREQAPGLIYAMATGSLAMLTGSAMAGHGSRLFFMIPPLAAVAGLVGGISRPLARAVTQFLLFTVIAANIGTGGNHSFVITVLFFLGAVWTTSLVLVSRPLFRAMSPIPIQTRAVQTSKYTARQYLRRWWKSLAHLSGWQYALRITLCLSAAEAFDWFFPNHHGYWASITVLIVVQRRLQTALTRSIDRAVGTTIGVMITGLLMLGLSSVWAIIAMIGVLAAARPILLEANYIAYAAVQTPLIIMLLDFGKVPSWTVAADRLAATLVGCTLGITLGYLGWSRIFTPGAADRERISNSHKV